MVSLNNLDEQIGALEEDEEEEPEEDPVSLAEINSPRLEDERGSKSKRMRKEKDQGEDIAREEAPKKKRKDKAARNAVCFRYFEGRCKFDDCKFLHVSPSKLTHDERAQVLRELPLREYSKKLAEVIAGLNIPRCKDFHQRGGCKRPAGKCHFWHLTDATVARWAGFDFWCNTCSKAFTSKDQMMEHKASKIHCQKAGIPFRPHKTAGTWPSRGRSGKGGRGCGQRQEDSEEAVSLRGRGRGRG
mmetsp:Transcript_15901/g.35066  ORF Transcript_15901/g.35066 Transcript_15901/m.35066 type:complete len:244 (-) Transcript_15901:91-822(-)